MSKVKTIVAKHVLDAEMFKWCVAAFVNSTTAVVVGKEI